jgi:hypothetical protein
VSEAPEKKLFGRGNGLIGGMQKCQDDLMGQRFVQIFPSNQKKKKNEGRLLGFCVVDGWRMNWLGVVPVVRATFTGLAALEGERRAEPGLDWIGSVLEFPFSLIFIKEG